MAASWAVLDFLVQATMWSVIPFTALRVHRKKAKFLRAGKVLFCHEFLVPVGNGDVDTQEKEDFLNLITVERL